MPKPLRPVAELRDVAHSPAGVAILLEQRHARFSAIEDITRSCETDKRGLLASEQRTCDRMLLDVDEIDKLMDVADEPGRRMRVAADAQRALGPGYERRDSQVYNADARSSFLLDLARAQLGDLDSRQRLDQFQTEQRVSPNRTDGTGGYFVPPLWLMEQFVPLARSSRVFADQCMRMPLPAGTDSLNLPKIATGATVAPQPADGAPVSATDITDTFVTTPVITLAGQQDVALQLIEQSPAGFDQVVFGDLSRALATQVDTQALTGSGTAGQVTGALTMSGTNQVIYTDSSATGIELYPSLAMAIEAVASGIFLPPTHCFMHPRRWYWLASQLDGSSRPLVVPYAQGPNNANAVSTAAGAQGPVGSLLGVDVWLDPNIPTNLGAGSNEDRIIVARMDQLYLWEGDLKVRALQEVLSGTLQVRLQVYEYLGFIGTRLPKSVSIISGTGLAQPAGFV